MNIKSTPSKKQKFKDDEAFYGDIAYDMNQKENKNNKNEVEDMFEDVWDDFEQYINNQNDSQHLMNNDKSFD